MIIGMVGFQGAGKGSVADMLVEKYGYTKVAFADPLKDAVAAIYGWPRHLLEGDTKESREFREMKDEWWSDRFGWEVTPRLILQKMGTEAIRNRIHYDIWLIALERRIHGIDKVVVSDVRFPNEMQFIKSKGGFNIRVKRGVEPEWFDAAYQANKDPSSVAMQPYNIHFSEWAWIGQPVEYNLCNDGSLDTLQANVTHMLSVFSGPKAQTIDFEKNVLYNED